MTLPDTSPNSSEGRLQKTLAPIHFRSSSIKKYSLKSNFYKSKTSTAKASSGNISRINKIFTFFIGAIVYWLASTIDLGQKICPPLTTPPASPPCSKLFLLDPNGNILKVKYQSLEWPFTNQWMTSGRAGTSSFRKRSSKKYKTWENKTPFWGAEKKVSIRRQQKHGRSLSFSPKKF